MGSEFLACIGYSGKAPVAGAYGVAKGLIDKSENVGTKIAASIFAPVTATGGFVLGLGLGVLTPLTEGCDAWVAKGRAAKPPQANGTDASSEAFKREASVLEMGEGLAGAVSGNSWDYRRANPDVGMPSIGYYRKTYELDRFGEPAGGPVDENGDRIR